MPAAPPLTAQEICDQLADGTYCRHLGDDNAFQLDLLTLIKDAGEGGELPPQLEGLALIRYCDPVSQDTTGFASVVLDEETDTTTTFYFDSSLNVIAAAPPGEVCRDDDWEYKWVTTCFQETADPTIKHDRATCIPILNGAQQPPLTIWILQDGTVTATAPADIEPCGDGVGQIISAKEKCLPGGAATLSDQIIFGSAADDGAGLDWSMAIAPLTSVLAAPPSPAGTVPIYNGMDGGVSYTVEMVDYAAATAPSALTRRNLVIENPLSQDGANITDGGFDQTTGSSLNPNAFLISFATPMSAWGGSFVDLESQGDGTITLFDASETELVSSPITFPGGEDGEDEVHFIGFTRATPDVSHVLIAVGTSATDPNPNTNRLAFGRMRFPIEPNEYLEIQSIDETGALTCFVYDADKNLVTDQSIIDALIDCPDPKLDKLCQILAQVTAIAENTESWVPANCKGWYLRDGETFPTQAAKWFEQSTNAVEWRDWITEAVIDPSEIFDCPEPITTTLCGPEDFWKCEYTTNLGGLFGQSSNLFPNVDGWLRGYYDFNATSGFSWVDVSAQVKLWDGTIQNWVPNAEQLIRDFFAATLLIGNNNINQVYPIDLDSVSLAPASGLPGNPVRQLTFSSASGEEIPELALGPLWAWRAIGFPPGSYSNAFPVSENCTVNGEAPPAAAARQDRGSQESAVNNEEEAAAESAEKAKSAAAQKRSSP